MHSIVHDVGSCGSTVLIVAESLIISVSRVKRCATISSYLRHRAIKRRLLIHLFHRMLGKQHLSFDRCWRWTRQSVQQLRKCWIIRGSTTLKLNLTGYVISLNILYQNRSTYSNSAHFSTRAEVLNRLSHDPIIPLLCLLDTSALNGCILINVHHRLSPTTSSPHSQGPAAT